MNVFSLLCTVSTSDPGLGLYLICYPPLFFLLHRVHYKSLWMTCLRPSSAQPIGAVPYHWPSNTCLTSWMSRPTNTTFTTHMSDTHGRATGEFSGFEHVYIDVAANNIHTHIDNVPIVFETKTHHLSICFCTPQFEICDKTVTAVSHGHECIRN